MTSIRTLAVAGTCALALVVAACGGASTSGGAPGAAGTDGKAADAFPLSTLLFVDASADVNSSAWQKLRTVLGRFPGYAQVEQKLVAEMSGDDDFQYARDIEPWLGDEVAVGVLAITLAKGEPAPQYVVYAESTDDAKAVAALTRDGTTKTTGEDRGYTLLQTEDGDVAAVGHNAVLLAGDSASLKESIDAREGPESDRLTASETFDETLATLPDDNVVVAYLDGPKLAQLADTAIAAAGSEATRGLPAGQLDQAMKSLDAIRAVGVSLGADEGGVRVHATTMLDGTKDAAKDRVEPGTIDLVDSAPADAVAFAGTIGAGKAVESTYQQLAAQPEVAQGIAGIEAMTGLNVEQDLLPLLSGEVGLYVGGGAPPSGALLLQPSDPEAAAASMGKITKAIGQLAQGDEDAPQFAPLPSGQGESAKVDGHTVSWVRADDVIALGFDTGGTPPAGGLGSSDAYTSVRDAAKPPDELSALLYLDVAKIVDLAQRASGEQAPADVQANLKALGGFLAWSTTKGDVAESEAYLQVR